MADDRHDPLRVRVENGRLVISIGVEILAAAAVNGGPLEHFDEAEEDYSSPLIVDVDVFAAEVAHELEREEEDGTTLMHKMLDEAILGAAESGCEGLNYAWGAPRG